MTAPNQTPKTRPIDPSMVQDMFEMLVQIASEVKEADGPLPFETFLAIEKLIRRVEG